MADLKIALFSDIHYSSDTRGGVWNGVQRKLIKHSLPIVDKLINEINQLKPDVAICLGDLIEDVNDRDQDIANLKLITEKLRAIEPPFYKIPGNHDLRTLSRDDVAKIFGYDQLTYATDVNGFHLVFIAPDIKDVAFSIDGGISRTRTVSDDDKAWLKADIAKNNLPSLYFCHYGLAEDDMAGNFWFSEKPEKALLADRDELKRLLKSDKNLLAVFGGHQHWTKHIVEDGIDYHLLGSLIEDINSDGQPDGVWFVLDVDGDSVHITENHVKPY